ncbi:radical SAM protein [Candidatus Bathyarchaeota archaeon]|nr:radical SAM protein [Candidatus Bathyarchaeota archaeon]
MEWICEGRVDSCSNELLRELAKAGCKIIYFGIESASQRILNYYGKQTTPQQSMKAVRKARKAGIDIIMASFIVGAPNETREEIMHTLEFAERIPIDLPQFNILGVHPGTDLWDELETRGLLKEGEHWETGVAVCRIYPGAVPFEEVEQMVHRAFYHFMRRPSFVLKQIARTMKSSFRMNCAVANLTRINNIRENVRSVT